jgi:hypothetical protein
LPELYGEDAPELWLPNQVMRERARVPATNVQTLNRVKGFLKPQYIDTLEDGRRVGNFSARDIQRVEDGYACGKCFAFFSERTDDCPCCGERLEPSKDIVDFLPDYWKPDPKDDR